VLATGPTNIKAALASIRPLILKESLAATRLRRFERRFVEATSGATDLLPKFVVALAASCVFDRQE
jgi:hypothetical protein